MRKIVCLLIVLAVVLAARLPSAETPAAAASAAPQESFEPAVNAGQACEAGRPALLDPRDPLLQPDLKAPCCTRQQKEDCAQSCRDGCAIGFTSCPFGSCVCLCTGCP